MKRTAVRDRSYLGLGLHGFHRLAYREWGDPDNPRVLVCVHGLTRNAHDFDEFASALSDHYRVICPDVVGRGQSDWLEDYDHYDYPQYLADMNALIARLGVAEVDWVGTSMGGLIGMFLAAMHGSPVTRLVINDIGPYLPRAALHRLGQYVGRAPGFDDLAGVEAYLRDVHAPFGDLSDAQWWHMAEHSAMASEEGGYRLAYDPRVGDAYRRKLKFGDVDLWSFWDRVSCPVLVLRGEQSDLLTDETARDMTRRGPRAHVVEIPGVGHAPALNNSDQVAAVRDWLLAEGA